MQTNTIRSFRNTKIVASLGPASDSERTLAGMLRAGMNVARFNFSHGTHEEHGDRMTRLREVSAKVKIPVALLQDLGGPKIRIGDFVTPTVKLVRGKRFVITTDRIEGTVERVSINYKKLPREVGPGASILLNDGKVHVRVTHTTATDIVCTVVIGGTIRGRRGVNVPGAMLSISAITPKDKKDLIFGLSQGVHFVTLSFVRTAQEVHKLRSLLGEHKDRVGIVAKIETREAVENLDAIIAAADAVMVARGDLAVEIPREEVPLVQKKIIRACNAAGKPVITATQMLDSMRENEAPTRAEVNDVANAIFDGSDAVMLSDETTIGLHPEAAVRTLDAIARAVEREGGEYRTRTPETWHEDAIAPSIALSVARKARELNTHAVVALTETGTTARLIARHRIEQPILVLTPREATFHQTLLVYGCMPVLVAPITSFSDALKESRAQLKRLRFAGKSDRFVLGAGMPFRQSGTTNMLIVEKV